jgi:hypothetical protein
VKSLGFFRWTITHQMYIDAQSGQDGVNKAKALVNRYFIILGQSFDWPESIGS